MGGGRAARGRQRRLSGRARELVAIEDNQKLTTKPVEPVEAGPVGEPVVSPEATGPSGEPVEPIEAVENVGEFPTLTDQGEEETAPRRRRRTSHRSKPTRILRSAPKKARSKPSAKAKTAKARKTAKASKAPKASKRRKPAKPRKKAARKNT